MNIILCRVIDITQQKISATKKSFKKYFRNHKKLWRKTRREKCIVYTYEQIKKMQKYDCSAKENETQSYSYNSKSRNLNNNEIKATHD